MVYLPTFAKTFSQTYIPVPWILWNIFHVIYTAQEFVEIQQSLRIIGPSNGGV